MDPSQLAQAPDPLDRFAVQCPFDGSTGWDTNPFKFDDAYEDFIAWETLNSQAEGILEANPGAVGEVIDLTWEEVEHTVKERPKVLIELKKSTPRQGAEYIRRFFVGQKMRLTGINGEVYQILRGRPVVKALAKNSKFVGSTEEERACFAPTPMKRVRAGR